jgi:AraC-like DNA-binding protein
MAAASSRHYSAGIEDPSRERNRMELRPGAAAHALRDAWSASARRRVLLHSADPDCAQGIVGRVFRPHHLVPHGRATRLQARLDHLPAGLLGFSSLSYGSAVDILPGPLESFYLLQIPLQGSAVIEAGDETFRSDPACASLLSPRPDLRMHWGDGNEQLIVRIESAVLQRFADRWCGSTSREPPTFAPRLPLDEHPALVDLLLSLIDVAHRLADPAPCERPSLSLLQLQYRLLATLLAGQPHSQRDRLACSGPPVAPRCVRQVEDYLVAHCADPLSPEALAAIAGVSVRSLFLGFQRYRGVSPMRLLRELRLQRVRDELLGAEPDARVGDIALRWGFHHLGRFGQEYREAFGESPRQTLLQRRRG